MTTAKQASVRMNSGHARLLATLEAGQKLDTTHFGFGELRGYMKVRATLAGWGAINGGEITDFGRAALAEYRARYPLQNIRPYPPIAA